MVLAFSNFFNVRDGASLTKNGADYWTPNVFSSYGQLKIPKAAGGEYSVYLISGNDANDIPNLFAGQITINHTCCLIISFS